MEFHLTGKNTFLDVLREMARDEVGAEARESGRVAQGRDDALIVLEQRFGPLAPATVRAIRRVKDVKVLRGLLKYAAAAATLEDFQRRLRALKG